MFLETTGSFNEEGLSSNRLHTPPTGAQFLPALSILLPSARREVVTDVTCAKTLIEALGDAAGEFEIVQGDLAWMLATGTASTLGQSTIVIAPVLANGIQPVE